MLGPALALAAAAALVVLSVRPDPPDVGMRGGAHQDATVRLELDRVHGKQSQRIADGDSVLTGDLIYFRVSATPPTEVRITVEGPAGREDVALHPARPEGGSVQGASGHVAYAVDAPGTYTFRASPESGGTGHALTVVAR